MQANELVVIKNTSNRGFTLIEMLITIVIVAIALTIGVPSMSKQIEKSRQNAMRSELQQSIRLAGAQALASSRPVVLCPGNSTCADNDWKNGYMLFIDSNGNGNYDVGTDRLLRQHENSSKRKITVKPRPQNSPSGGKFYFLPNGASSGGTINICSESEKGIDQRLIVSGFGSAELQKDQTDACS